MTSEKLNKLGLKTALISFLIGIAIFLFYYFTSNFYILFLGYFFTGIACIFNLVILILIILEISKYCEIRKKFISTSLIMLFNIPIMITFVWLTLILINTMRINFKNTTQTAITDIEIIGCDLKHINKLEPNESITIWIKINNDCSIQMNYLQNKKRETETVAGYITGGMGQKMNYNIGSKSELVF